MSDGHGSIGWVVLQKTGLNILNMSCTEVDAKAGCLLYTSDAADE